MAPQKPKHYLAAPVENHQLLPKAPWAAQTAWQSDSSLGMWDRALPHCLDGDEQEFWSSLILSQPGERRERFIPPVREMRIWPLGNGVEDLRRFVSAQPCSLVLGEPRKGWHLSPGASPAFSCVRMLHTMNVPAACAARDKGILLPSKAALSPTGRRVCVDSVLLLSFPNKLNIHFQVIHSLLCKWFSSHNQQQD